MKRDKSESVFKNIVIFLLVALSIYFVVSNSNNRSSYRDEIRRLEAIADSLNMKLSVAVPRDSITYYLTQQEYYSDIIEQLNSNIEQLRKEYDKKSTLDVDSFSIDDNVRLLIKFLSEAPEHR